MKNRIISTLLAVCFLVMLLPSFALAATFSDLPNDYSTKALEAAVANGLLNGSNGKISPNDNLTRAQMAAIISRAFGATKQASLATYNDVSQADWFYADMAKAVQMEVLKGEKNLLKPDTAVTRQEVFVVLSRALKLEDGTEANLSAFSDKADVASWAVGATAALVSGAYINGADGKLNPKANISRKDFAVLMNNIVKTYIKTAGVVTEIKDGSVMINVPGVTLKNVTIKGNLIIGDGVGDGEVTLDNVKVEGRTVVRGGGTNSFIIKGNSSLGIVTVAKVDGNIRIFVDGSAVEVVEINDGKDDVLVEGTIAKLVIEASDVPVSVQHATIKDLTVSASGVSLSVAKDSKVTSLLAEGSNAKLTIAGAVDTLTAAKTAEGAKIEVAAGATVGSFNTAAPKSQITGDGTVKTANVTGNDVKVDTKGTQLTVGSGVTGTTSSGKTVEGGTSTKTDGQSNSGSSTGVGGGGLVTPTAPLVVSTVTTATPKADGTGSGASNIGNYTVGTATGAAPSFATVITGTAPLVDVVSANAQQGTAKWVGVLITTDKDVTSLAVKTPGMSAFSNLTQADVDEAVSAGATGTKTFVWWLKAENIGTGKDILIKAQNEQDSTAVMLNVSIASTVTQDPGKTGGTGATFDATTITFGGTIDYYPADVSLGRTEGNRIGVQITAPSGVTVDKDNATFKYTSSKGEEKTLVNKTDKWMDGDNFVYYYPLVTKPGETFTVVIDWDGTSTKYAPETIKIKIAADAKLVVPVKTAQLHDTSNEIADTDLVSDYSVIATKGSNNNVAVTIKATDLQYHKNGEGNMGFWIGFAVQAPKDAAKLKYAFGIKLEDTQTLSGPVDLEAIDTSGTKGISFYTDLTDETPKTWCRVQWLDANGNVLGSDYTYKINFSKVTLKLAKDITITANAVIRNNLTVDANISLLGGVNNANGIFLSVVSGANLTLNSGKSLTVTTSANLIVMKNGNVNLKDGTIKYLNNGKSVVYYGASYIDKDLSIGNIAGTDFTLTSSDGYAGVGNFLVSGEKQPVRGIVLKGDATLNSNYAIASDKTLAVLQDKTLTISAGKTLTVSGRVMNSGTITNNGSIKLEIGGQVLGNSILNYLQNGVISGLLKTDTNNYTLTVAGTNVPSGVPAQVSDLFYNDKALTIKTQDDLTVALDNTKHTAIAINFNMLSDIIKADKYYRFVQTNDALKPYVSPEDERVAAVTNGGVTAYVKTPTTGWYGNDILSDYYAMLILQGKGATIEIYEGDAANSCTNKVATVVIGNNITFAS